MPSTRFPDESHMTRWSRIVSSDPCTYCLERRSDTVDHIRARSQGGRNQDNRIGACARCNSHKASHSMLAFLRTHGYPVRLY